MDTFSQIFPGPCLLNITTIPVNSPISNIVVAQEGFPVIKPVSLPELTGKGKEAGLSCPVQCLQSIIRLLRVK